MAVLAAMVSIALDMVVRVAATFWTTALVQEFVLKESMSDGMTSQAMQQGGMGLILTTLILTAPPMAAMFFQGTLGSFMAYSQIGGSMGNGAPGPNGQPAGSYSVASAPAKGGGTGNADMSGTHATTRMSVPQSDSSSAADTGLRAAHPGKQ